MDNNKPEYGKTYALTGKTGDKCISNGNNWAESEVKETKPSPIIDTLETLEGNDENLKKKEGDNNVR